MSPYKINRLKYIFTCSKHHLQCSKLLQFLNRNARVALHMFRMPFPMCSVICGFTCIPPLEASTLRPNSMAVMQMISSRIRKITRVPMMPSIRSYKKPPMRERDRWWKACGMDSGIVVQREMLDITVASINSIQHQMNAIAG